jgi:NCAIR mutase (PurE)-related protein
MLYKRPVRPVEKPKPTSDREIRGDMRDVLEALAAGQISVEAAEAKISGYVTSEAGRFDAARVDRSGVPEAILATGKTPKEVATLAVSSLESTDRAIVTRTDETDRNAIREHLDRDYPDASVEVEKRAGGVVVHTPEFERPALDARVGVVTAGTSDAAPAAEAELIISETGGQVERIDDVGVASLARLLDTLPTLRAQDVLVVAAGREGALPTVVAGLVDVPVIGLPVSTGYGHGGDGEAALIGMLQSCTVLSVVNIDAGFTAGAQASLIARQTERARTE